MADFCYKVVDLSKWNGAVDFNKVKASGIKGVILRAGFGRSITQKDSRFEEYYRLAKMAGLYVGAYWYSYTLTVSEAVTEAKCFLEAVKGKQFELPLYFDIEEQSQMAKGSEIVSNIADTFCKTIENAGYFAGIYSFDSFFNLIKADIQKRYTIWVARVENVKPAIAKQYDMHQYTWKARINGISDPCDCSYCYKDFPVIISKAGLNGFDMTRYKVTAVKTSLNKVQADEIGQACSKLGMTAVIEKE